MWVGARVAVLLALWVGHVVGHDHQATLLGWDAYWYHLIAQHGYGAVRPEAVRFFPLLPLLARLLALPTGGHTSVSLLLIANAASIAYAVAARELALAEGMDRRVADRLPYLVTLAPAAFIMVMGYTEPLFGLLLCVVLITARRRRWLWCAVAAAFIGALRPTGVLVGLPILIEALIGVRAASGRERAARLVAVAAPAIGLGSFLLWCAVSFHDALKPLQAQTDPNLRGGVLVDPLPTVWRCVGQLFEGHYTAARPLVHVPWAVVAVILVVLCARRLPLSFTAFSAVTVFLALTGRHLASFERYAASAVPLLLVVAEELSTRQRRAAAWGIGVVSLVGYAYAAYLGKYIP